MTVFNEHEQQKNPTAYSNRTFLLVATSISIALSVLAPYCWNISEVFENKHVAMIQLVWCGMVIGISLLEAWVKFRAQYCVRYVALDIGRTVFFALNRAEVLICCSLFLMYATTGGTNIRMILLDWIPIVLLVLQVIFLQPILDASGRYIITETIVHKKKHVTGQAPLAHIVYVLFELIKVVLLIWTSGRKL